MKRIFGAIFLIIALFAGIALFFAGTIFVLPKVNHSTFKSGISQDNSDSLSNPEKEIARLKKNIAEVNKKIEKLTPGSAFIIINTSENSFRLFKDNRLIRSGMCSTGSFKELIVNSKKSYLFETPKGALTVRNKKTDPVWAKPDWAFIEEGLPVPPPGHSSRFEKYVLGKYALELGDGYMLHGTIYQRFLGMPVTHGCVRLGDDDLEIIFKTLQIGSRVFII
jgi:lipoprotein-anchoring transpeptidase ErfK/SrfK